MVISANGAENLGVEHIYDDPEKVISDPNVDAVLYILRRIPMQT